MILNTGQAAVNTVIAVTEGGGQLFTAQQGAILMIGTLQHIHAEAPVVVFGYTDDTAPHASRPENQDDIVYARVKRQHKDIRKPPNFNGGFPFCSLLLLVT